jgi:hypothetical protein
MRRLQEQQRDSRSILRSLLDSKEAIDVPWQAEDLPAILEHQLSAPLVGELEAIAPDKSTDLVRDAGKLSIHCLADVLAHPKPPVEILKCFKQWAKAEMEATNSGLPEPILKAIYTAVVMKGLVTGNRNFTTLPHNELQKSSRWCLAQSWLNPALARTLRECLKQLSP